MAVEITQDIFVVIWISSVVSAILSHYLPKDTFRFTRSEFPNILVTALVLGFGILVVVILGLQFLKFVG